MIIPLIILITVAPLLTFGESCGPKFNGKCTCGIVDYTNEGQRYVVNCTDTGFKDTTILEYLPEQTQVLIFNGNFIPELPWNIFGAFNDLSSLSIVDMSNNHIREIRGKSFHHIQHVKRLILNHNNISISRDDDEMNHHHPRVFSNFLNLMELHLTNAFADNTSAELSEDLHDIFVNSNLTKLMKLHLEQNEIKSFRDPRVFCDLPSLRDLHLGDNLLKEINFNVVCLKNLRFLDLERNKFTHFRPKDLSTLDLLENLPNRDVNLIVDFTFNPIVCDCNVYNFQTWIEETKVTVRNVDDLVCYRNGHDQQEILSLKTNKCRLMTTMAQSSAGHTVTLVFLLIVLVCILIGLIGALLYVSKDRYKNMLNPVLSSVSKKVHYTTIKDEECPEVHV